MVNDENEKFEEIFEEPENPFNDKEIESEDMSSGYFPDFEKEYRDENDALDFSH